MDKKIRVLIVIAVFVIAFVSALVIFNIFGNAERNRFVGTWKTSRYAGERTYIFRSDGTCKIDYSLGHMSGRYSVIGTGDTNVVHIISDDGKTGEEYFYEFSENDTKLRLYQITQGPYGPTTSGIRLIKQ